MNGSDLTGTEKRATWNTLSRALGAEPREHREIRGASGLDHQVEAIAVDEERKRIILFAAEPNPRIAALMQFDVQQAFEDTRVLVARPVAIDLAALARGVAQQMGSIDLNLTDLHKQIDSINQAEDKQARAIQAFGGVLGSIGAALSNVELPPLNQILAVVQQAAQLDWAEIGERLQPDRAKDFAIPLMSPLTFDTIAFDRQHGICGLPLYQFTQSDWDLLFSGRDIEGVEQRLKTLGILQYFFPAPDHLALGLAERGHLSRDALVIAAEMSPALGHPFGSPEIAQESLNLVDYIDFLTDRGLMVQGEIGYDVTPKGTKLRNTVKFQSREGLLSKLLGRFSAKANLSVKADTSDITKILGS